MGKDQDQQKPSLIFSPTENEFKKKTAKQNHRGRNRERVSTSKDQGWGNGKQKLISTVLLKELI